MTIKTKNHKLYILNFFSKKENMNTSINTTSSPRRTNLTQERREELTQITQESNKIKQLIISLNKKLKSENSESNYIRFLEATIIEYKLAYRVKKIEIESLKTELLSSKVQGSAGSEETENQRPVKRRKPSPSVEEPQDDSQFKRMRRAITDQEDRISRLEAANTALTTQLRREIMYKEEFTASKEKSSS